MTLQVCPTPCPIHSEAFQLWREDIRAAIAKLQEGQERLEHAVLGNGQPGALKELDARVKALEDHKAQIVGRGTVWALVGALLVAIIASVTGAAVSSYFQSRRQPPPQPSATRTIP